MEGGTISRRSFEFDRELLYDTGPVGEAAWFCGGVGSLSREAWQHMLEHARERTECKSILKALNTLSMPMRAVSTTFAIMREFSIYLL